MKTNVGQIDRIIRIIIGAALIAATLLGHIGGWGWLGILLLASGIFSYCPGYALCGKSTCKKTEAK
jgi:hypothetical protein